MDTLYVETSIVSYLRQRPSSQVVIAARQLLTHKWWNNERSNYELVTSQYVIDEVSGCDSPPLSDSGGGQIMVSDGGLKDERVGRGRVAA